jgi:manganese/zinc/iron transport system permease protein
VQADVWLLGGITVLLLSGVTLAFKEFKLLTFDAAFAASLGWPVGRLELLLGALIVLSVTVGLQLVGVVLMAAMLITPAAAARFWTDRLPRMLWIAAAVGALSGALGAYVSMLAPRMPTGPWAVIAATFGFTVSMLFAPRRGIVARLARHQDTRRRTAEENALKTIYMLGEGDEDWRRPRDAGALARRRRLPLRAAERTLAGLARSGWVERAGDGWSLTGPGLDRARRMVRLHRLWEVYLAERLNLAADHVHEDAEHIEHVLTPELEAELEAILARPEYDPHRRPIPYDPAPVSAAAEPAGARVAGETP